MTTANTAISALVVMGVSGCGKSAVGAEIALNSGGRLIEGDAFHPPANIEKMSAGTPLNDEDRAGWLTRLGEEMAAALANGEHPVLTCSSLKLTSIASACVMRCQAWVSFFWNSARNSPANAARTGLGTSCPPAL
ncbi:carbohydrate kinase (thermoresistant glucokinase family) [Pseudomonas sp. PvP046]